ncbi:MAG: hypothetical protein A2231_03075 [Candidatus Firestonebacteria bacterium RIFOXYA2_FULL_40_8]|nr:MAG: hypothetical protein A2231_03075 [Candidatus Firestonebacteria bacterium RIFOXYA2_FULL_40_8]
MKEKINNEVNLREIATLVSNGFSLTDACRIVIAICAPTIALNEKMKTRTANIEEKTEYYNHLCSLILTYEKNKNTLLRDKK